MFDRIGTERGRVCAGCGVDLPYQHRHRPAECLRILRRMLADAQHEVRQQRDRIDTISQNNFFLAGRVEKLETLAGKKRRK